MIPPPTLHLLRAFAPRSRYRAFLGACALLLACGSAGAAPLTLPARSRSPEAADTNQWVVNEKTLQWDPGQTAMVICDMWDKHWCAGATRRVSEMAARMNAVIRQARSQGVFIIHCPSDTMKFYADTPGRKLAQSAPPAQPVVPLQNWCALDRNHEAPLPIDDSDGGCDDWPQCTNYTAWKQQIPTLQIEPGDAITDSAEAYYLMQQRGIQNVIVMGVHLNMCVLGRPFSIRQMVKQGKNVVLMRDLTDTMYNSRQRPFVPHCVGTTLMLEHVEKFWCPTITSVAFLGGAEFHFSEDRRPHVVMLIGEDEYHTWETLPLFARQELGWRGLRVSIVQEEKERPGNFPELIDALRDADLLLVSARRRGLPKAQLDAIRAHLDAGKPLIGLRTASHAFAPRPPGLAGNEAWPGFDPEVLGGNYTGHHAEGPMTTVQPPPGAPAHPILTGVDLPRLQGHGSLYKASPLRPSAIPLLIGAVPGQPAEPVAWTHTFGTRQARIFYTSFGHPNDFTNAAFRRLLLNAILWSVDQPLPPPAAPAQSAGAAPSARDWQLLQVPGAWEDQAHLDYDGIAWYRCVVQLPSAWQGKDVTLAVEHVDNAHEAYFNGARIGGAGRFPPAYQNGIELANRYVVPADRWLGGGGNLIAIRVYDHDGRGGFKGEAPELGTDAEHISLKGLWSFRTGDDPRWADPSALPLSNATSSVAMFSKIESGAVARGSAGHKMAPRGTPLPPAEAARSFTVPDDLEFEQVLAEPEVRQPVFLNFDERGRLWVVQYIQYPAPAGLNVISKDQWWRAVYDKVPEPPPRGVRGLDKITIHEDTDGDGRFDKHRTFVDGLNIATAVARGRGGVWVLNPPYLLFYPDADNDDVPDGPPLVHLEGFGLEDTHSVVNSLRWGPDGWLYAAQGSTVTGHIRVPALPADRARDGSSSNAVAYSQGQNIWRYHPETRRYEVFSEGGGNAFGVELDPQGRIYSGHNGGDTRGFHYMQGAYLRKGFEKHGELSNPYAFGYFPHMPGTAGERFTHNFVLYHGGHLPAKYDGNLFGVEPLQGRVVRSEIAPTGSTFRTRDLERVVTSSDSWFRPVDIKVGPDGAIYVCDWYDRQVTHTRNQEGNIDTSNGRIYRLKQKGAPPMSPFNLAARSSAELVGMLNHENDWFRQTALRLLADRRDATVVPALQKRLGEQGPGSLAAVWALHACGGFNGSTARTLLDHPEPQVRLWAVRLLGDERRVAPELGRAIAQLAAREPDLEVRAQLACTAKRLPAAEGLPIIASLARHRGDADDPRLPLLCWWAIEAQCSSSPSEVLKLFEDSPFWSQPLVEQHLLDRTMRRFAATGARKDLLACARLLELSPSPQHSERLMRGFEEAFKGRSLAGLPAELISAMDRHQVSSPAFRLRQGTTAAVDLATRVIADPKADKAQRLQFIQIMGEVRPPGTSSLLLRLLEQTNDPELLRAALNSLTAYDEPRIGAAVAALYPKFAGEVRLSAQTLLASRSGWSLALAQQVADGRIAPDTIPSEQVRRMQWHKNPELATLIAKLWPRANRPTSEGMQQQIQHLVEVVRAGQGDPYRGQKLFNATCASCHKLFAQGGQVGPDLTSYQRGDLETMLLNIVNPSAEIREGFESFVIETKDERTLSGFLVERDPQVVVLRGVDGQNVTLEQKEIAEMKAGALSLMPDGLLDPLNEQQVRDLFAYLRSTQPLAN